MVNDVNGPLAPRRRKSGNAVALDSPVEDLGLSVRTRNALRSIGCNTVEDALRLELSASLRGFGDKTKKELLTALARAGFNHPAFLEQQADELKIFERGLERMQGRVDAALAAVAKEIRLLKHRLHRKVTSGRGKGDSASGRDHAGS